MALDYLTPGVGRQVHHSSIPFGILIFLTSHAHLIHHPVVEADQRQMGLRNDQVLVISVIRNQRHPALNLQGALTHARQIVAVT